MVVKKGKNVRANKASVGKITPQRRPWVATGLALVGLLTLVALWDYDPSSIHESPPRGDPHLLGGAGAVSYTHLTLPTICSV